MAMPDPNNPDFWPWLYRRDMRSGEALVSHYAKLKRRDGVYGEALLAGYSALKHNADRALTRARDDGQLLRCHP